MKIQKPCHGVCYRQGKILFYFFPPQNPIWALNQSKHCDMFTFGGWCGGGGNLINAREDYFGTALFCWETQHLKSPGATPMQEKRCCHADEVWLVGKQVQERSLQITLSLNLMLRKTKAASGISAKNNGNVVIGEVGAEGDESYEMHLFQSCEVPQHIEALQWKSGEMDFDTNVSSKSARCTSPCQDYA